MNGREQTDPTMSALVPDGGSILVVDDEPNICQSIEKALERSGYQVATCADAVQALQLLEHRSVDLVLCDIRMPGMDGLELLLKIKELDPSISVVMITGYASIESAVASMKAGADDYVSKPFRPAELRAAVAKILSRKRLAVENVLLKRELAKNQGPMIVGNSPMMRRLLDEALLVARQDVPVLLLGESGTGKEVLARTIHQASLRKDHPFVGVNCTAFPDTLADSELFGYVRGAFTGATTMHRGSFEVAHLGTLFLDEIGEMKPEIQVKLLRALEEKEIKRLGSETPVRVNVRLIAASNRNLAEEVNIGNFRKDLFYRISAVTLTLPPLRERIEDIEPLARHFLDFFTRELKKSISDISPDVLHLLLSHAWPGNIRELRNVIERAVIFAPSGAVLRAAHLPNYLRQSVASHTGEPKLASLSEMEKLHIRQVLELCHGNRSRAAEVLKISPVTLWRKLKEEGSGSEE
ncbi:MAG: sigma-54-dependent Fis family transcriptional regulator [Acidobacteria bacterium]|nr:sigma-54-dependent Fis family transcriptional regulator [Acidobacteriota bacterium]